MRAYGVSLLATVVILALGPTTYASDLAPVASSCSYDVGLTDELLVTSYPVPGSQPITGDGSVDIGGCVWEFPDTSSPGFPGANFEGLGNPACKDIGAGLIPEGMACVQYGILVGGQYSTIQVSVTDSVHGTDVGVIICSDNDNDLRCGDASKGETYQRFCSSGSTSATDPSGVPNDSDGNAHVDWGHALWVIIEGPLNQGHVHQTLPDDIDGDPGWSCNPLGGTRGTITVNFSG